METRANAGMPAAPAKLPACLLSPTYLGVHELAALGDEVVLDGGLRIYSGSATDSSSSAAHAMASGGVPGSPLSAWVPQGSKEQSSGIEGIYLRATLRTPLGDIGSEKSAHMWLELDAPGVGTPERLRKIGPYRLRVLRVWETDRQGSTLSEPAERTVSVRLAVDKVRIRTTRRPDACARGLTTGPSCAQVHAAEAAAAQLTIPLRDGEGAHAVWLSTQAATAVTLGPARADENSPAGPPSPPSPPARDCGLPPLPALGVGDGGGGGGGGGASLEVHLHALPLQSDGATHGDGGFGAPASLWRAELDVMAYGGSERHMTVPLHLDAPTRVTRVGEFDLTVEQVTGHFCSPAPPDAAPAGPRADAHAELVLSMYPILLLHVRLGMRRVAAVTPADAAIDERQALADGLERLLGL